MVRKYWYVFAVDDSWQVSETWGGQGGKESCHRTREAGMQVARSLAEDHYRSKGVPTGVRVLGLDARWWECSAFGEE